MAAKNTAELNVTPISTAAAEPSFDEIAVRAHQLFEQRGSTEGHDLDDWLQAERELREHARNRNGAKPQAKHSATSAS